MKIRSKRIFAAFIAVMTLISLFCLPLSVRAEGELSDDGKMNLDVVFVVDASGSMFYSDPDNIASDALNLLVDLCDESCGIGFDVYTQKIVAAQGITPVSDKKKFAEVNKQLRSIKYDPVGDTDIALGLTKAKKTFDANKNSDKNRKKAIVLLSDGNTDLPNGPRTVAESKKEMESTLSELAKAGIPVYAIGLNANGSLDKKEIDNITKKTKGKSYETNTSDKLSSIVSDIYADIYNIGGTDLPIKDDGTVDIKIKDNSVFYVNVIIRSRLSREELNPTLKDPKGNSVKLDGQENIKLSSTSAYTMLKLINPMPGTWVLHLDHATKDNCSIRQLDFYSVYVSQTVREKAGFGETVSVKASLNDSKGVVNDEDLLKTIKMTAEIKSKTDSTTQKLELTPGENGVFVGEFVPETEGIYVIKTTAVSDKFEKQSSSSKLTVGGEASVILETSEDDLDYQQGSYLFGMIIRIVAIVIGVIIIIVVIVVVISVARAAKEKKVVTTFQNERPKEEPKPAPRPQPRPQPVETVKKGPEATDPDYVDIPLYEHDALENLIKKGTDDAFSTKGADEYRSDASLEALIKKGADDPFQAKSEDYKIDENLASLIKTGGDGLEGVGKEEESYDDYDDEDGEYDDYDDDYGDDDYE